MRTTIAATGVALALLAGCGGGDSDTALTPGSSSTPTVEPSTDATASATASAKASTKASTKAKPKKTSSTSSGDPYFHPGTASGDHLPLTGGAPLPEHAKDAPYPASQLKPEFASDVVVECGGYQFPVDRLLNRRPASDLTATAKKFFTGYIDTGKNGIVAIADEKHILLLEGYGDDSESFDFAVAYYEVKADGKYRWWVDLDYPPDSCTFTRVLPDLEQVFWTLAVKPKPGDRSIQVSLYGSDCNGKSATDRLKVAILGVAKDGIRIAIGEELAPDGVKCAKSKEMLYTVALPEPIGDRPVIFVGTYPEAEPRKDYPTGEFAEPED